MALQDSLYTIARIPNSSGISFSLFLILCPLAYCLSFKNIAQIPGVISTYSLCWKKEEEASNKMKCVYLSQRCSVYNHWLEFCYMPHSPRCL